MAHIHDKIDFTVEVFIVHENKVLLRKHDKYGIWLSVGGHVELDEDPTEAAVREVKEEVGIDVELWDSRTWPENSDEVYRELIPPVSMGRHTAIHPTRNDHEHVVFVYFARAHSDKVKVEHDGDRSDEWRWCTKEELGGLELLDNVRSYALKALETLDEA
jgi:8-oxo-dGTP pyrophosphatase MutT (NUDIX family)